MNKDGNMVRVYLYIRRILTKIAFINVRVSNDDKW
jgi:hypothetical protein